MVNIEELIGATEYLTLYTRCRLNRCRYNRVRLQYPFKTHELLHDDRAWSKRVAV
jgi:hypothetical protein